MMEATLGEQKVINALKRVAKKWPKSLWLYSASGTLHVMKAGENRDQVHLGEGISIDPDYCLDIIDIPNDGGDW